MGLPPIADAGNVLPPQTSLELSLRLPPTVGAAQASRAMKRVLEADPPAGANVSFEIMEAASGWNASPTEPWLARAIDERRRGSTASLRRGMGEGGTIPFMAMLGTHNRNDDPGAAPGISRRARYNSRCVHQSESAAATRTSSAPSAQTSAEISVSVLSST